MSGREGITTSEEEATEILKRTRAELIAAGRRIAVDMLLSGNRPEGITTGDLFTEMKARAVPALESVKAHWLPVVFKNPRFTKASAGLQTGLGHDTLSHCWRLKY